ncbi:MAG: hypothetical protein ACKOCW_05460, partial [Planctomycetaceae bacterium]
TRRSAGVARDSLAVVDQLHGDLTRGLGRLGEAATVMTDVEGLCGRLVDAGPLVTRAAGVAAEGRHLEERIVAGESGIAAAREAVGRMETLADAVRDAAEGSERAAERLARLTRVKDDLVGAAGSAEEAAATLDRLETLVAGLAEAKGTLGDIQHMVVDVMLLRPAVDRAVETLQPVIEFTKAARAVDAAPVSAGSGDRAAPSAAVGNGPVVDVARSIGDGPQ